MKVDNLALHKIRNSEIMFYATQFHENSENETLVYLERVLNELYRIGQIIEILE